MNSLTEDYFMQSDYYFQELINLNYSFEKKIKSIENAPYKKIETERMYPTYHQSTSSN